MSWQVEYFGEELKTKDGLKPTSEILSGKKAIGIYFSAHWCPPCRGFTPVLAEFYEELKGDAADIEIVFVSSDRDEASYDSYYGSMPWVSLPFSQQGKKGELASKFGVSGIPKLVILNADGTLKDSDGRNTVVSSQGNVSKAYEGWIA